MNTITKRARRNLSIIFIIASIGALFLTYVWAMSVFQREAPEIEHPQSLWLLCYYIFNSVMLALSGILLLVKSVRAHAYVAITLGLSVAVSLLVPADLKSYTDSSESILYSIFLGNLFAYTVIIGMSFGAFFGGFLLIPMFLWSVYKNAITGFRFLRGKIQYNLEDEVKNSSAEQIEGNKPEPGLLKKKLIFNPTITIGGIVLGLLISLPLLSLLTSDNYNLSMFSIRNSIFTIVVYLGLPIATLITRNQKVYNLMLVVIGLYLLPWILMPFMPFIQNIVNFFIGVF